MHLETAGSVIQITIETSLKQLVLVFLRIQHLHIVVINLNVILTIVEVATAALRKPAHIHLIKFLSMRTQLELAGSVIQITSGVVIKNPA